ncbi:LacI family DNA-binding transcriptional regulator [bacterium]|nr:LacI family DNA-binding transcriptional regulator [bacterium]
MCGTPKRCTIKDIAAQSGVSLSTVSLVMNQNPRISAATRERVLATIARLGYQPNRQARSLARQRSHTLAVLVPQLRRAFADVYFGEIVSGIYDRAVKFGYKVLLEVVRKEFLESKEHLQLFEQKVIDGMLFLGANARHTFVADFVNHPYPFLLVNTCSPQYPLHHVVSDYRYGAWQATMHLVRLGHRRIGVLAGGLADIQTSQDLLASFQDVVREYHLEFGPDLLVDGWLTEEGGFKAAGELLRQHPGVTAIFALNDKMAIGAVRAIHHLGRRCPDDVAVVGFDDIPQASFCVPALTTVRQPLYEIGKLSCERLIELVRGRTEPVRDIIPIQLVVRESCGAQRREATTPGEAPARPHTEPSAPAH